MARCRYATRPSVSSIVHKPGSPPALRLYSDDLLGDLVYVVLPIVQCAGPPVSVLSADCRLLQLGCHLMFRLRDDEYLLVQIMYPKRMKTIPGALVMTFASGISSSMLPDAPNAENAIPAKTRLNVKIVVFLSYLH